MKMVKGFVKGICTGIAVGAAMGAVGGGMMRQKRTFKKNANKALRVVGGLLDNAHHMMK